MVQECTRRLKGNFPGHLRKSIVFALKGEPQKECSFSLETWRGGKAEPTAASQVSSLPAEFRSR